MLLPLQLSWVISVELAIGPEEGISYLTDKGSTVSRVTLPPSLPSLLATRGAASASVTLCPLVGPGGRASLVFTA